MPLSILALSPASTGTLSFPLPVLWQLANTGKHQDDDLYPLPLQHVTSMVPRWIFGSDGALSRESGNDLKTLTSLRCGFPSIVHAGDRDPSSRERGRASATKIVVIRIFCRLHRPRPRPQTKEEQRREAGTMAECFLRCDFCRQQLHVCSAQLHRTRGRNTLMVVSWVSASGEWAPRQPVANATASRPWRASHIPCARVMALLGLPFDGPFPCGACMKGPFGSDLISANSTSPLR